MSKANRRRQRPGSRPPAGSSSAAPPPNPARPATPSGSSPAAPSSSGGAAAGASGASRPPTSGTPRPTGAAPRPSSAARHGRRERQRAVYKPSFMERYRTAIIVVAALAGVALLSVFVFLSAAQQNYACSTTWTPDPTPSPAAGATPNLGYVQPDMGRQHVPTGSKVTYTYCAPASGSHYAQPAAPIAARVYGPGDNVIPQGWIHNLEHGALVVLYQGSSTGATPDGQAQLKAFYDAFPASPVCQKPKGEIGPVIARFDQMNTPFQAIVWGRVLPLQTFDQATILAFWNQWGERTNPEKQCAVPSASPATSAAPSGSAAPSAAPSGSAAPSPSSAPSASAAPSAS